MATLLIGQSGGPTTVINASLIGIVKAGLKEASITKILGARFGLKGILDESFIEFTDESLNDIINTPSAYLGSVRFHLKDYPDDYDKYHKLLEVFKKYDVKYFAYIGGNDSMDTCLKIDEFFHEVHYNCKVFGIPKTIDNDLMVTNNAPGYGSAAKFIATTLEEIYFDTSVYEIGRVTIVEIMGRDAGWLTAAAKIPSLNGAPIDLIYLPELPFDIELFLKDVKRIYDEKKKVLIAVSEGLKGDNGEYLLKHREFNLHDDFGHLQLGGIALILAQVVKERLDLPVRGIELNLPQRCAMHLASKTDLLEAEACGKYALKYMLKGLTGKMVTIMPECKPKYRYTDLINVAGLVKPFPIHWIVSNNDISNEYLEYVLPLIKGEIKLKYQNGIPVFKKL